MPLAHHNLEKIESLLPDALRIDRDAVKRQIRRIQRSGNGSPPNEAIRKELLRLEKRLQTSIKKKSSRIKKRPELVYNPQLPITAKKDVITNAIQEHQVLIISGETGSGKTTQIPKFCIAAGRGIDGKIGCTQPRRIAATTVSRRIAEELAEELGKSVGYKVRFQDKSPKDAFIKIMTDGILLAETQSDPYLNEYDTIIVDEAHERSLNIDFVLGILKTLLKKRSDLKLIITSATIDTEKFSNAFGNAPVIEVSGRMYPVEVRYFVQPSTAEANDELTHIEMAVQALDELQRETAHGDILIFMPTEQDIRETCEGIEGKTYPNTIVFPLYARLAASEQARVFAHTGTSKTGSRKIIVATNVAETSLTIPGIKYVIDTGLARIPQYSPRSRTTSLPVVPISRSSADQRKGRCGRVANGVCVRIFSEEDYRARPLFTPPEILRANLAEVILRMIALNLGDIADFPFIDRPASKNISDGFNLLIELGAIFSKASGKHAKGAHRFSLTKRGKLMAKIPLDPRISRMLIEAHRQNCLHEVSIIASALSIQDPRERPAEKSQEADRIHATFNDPASDFITLLNIWNRFHHALQKLKSSRKVKKFCLQHYLSFKRMREWRDIQTQIASLLQEYGLNRRGKQPHPVTAAETQAAPDLVAGQYNGKYAAIHQSILTGFLSNIAVKKDKNIFNAAKGRQAMLFPGSGLFNAAGKWIVAAEMVETSRVFARTAANIDSSWLESVGKYQCKYTYLDPHWEKNRGEVVAYEQVSLYGLIIVPRRPASFGRIDPEKASDIFIQSALVQGDIKQKFAFLQHNRNLADEIQNMEDRLRRRDVLISDPDLFQFYKQRLPGIYDIRTLARHLKKKGNDEALRMKKEDLLRYSPDETELELFPEKIALGSRQFQCSYKFEPGEPNDGITVKIPANTPSAVPPESLDWLVPGLLKDKIITLIRGLPKTYRKRLVPVTQTADVIVKEMMPAQTSLISALGDFIHKRFGLNIPASVWPQESLPDHLKMRIAITGSQEEVLQAGRDTRLLNQRITHEIDPDELASAQKKWERTGITRWDFGNLPANITIKGKDGARWTLYPGLQKGKQGVNLRLFPHRTDAVNSHRKGVAELFTRHFRNDLKFLKKNLVLPANAGHLADYFEGRRRFEKRLYESIVQDLFSRNIRTANEFHSHANSVAPILIKKGQQKLKRVLPVLSAYHEARSTLYDLETANRFNAASSRFIAGLREELSRLVPQGFMDLYDADQLHHMVRYIRTLGIRAQRGVASPEKDESRAEAVKFFTDNLNALLKDLSPSVSEEKRQAIEKYFWLIEEYKVSLFAQELKTVVPVSPKRLNRKLEEIQRMV